MQGRQDKGCHMNYKHGLAHSRIDAVYKSMKDRCYNPNNKRYKNYGARGIVVCDEWLSDKSSFFKWAYEHGYDDKAPRGETTIDRIDVNGNYSPQNCRFISVKDQNNNRRTNILITYKGEKHTMSEWADIKNIPLRTLWNRINVLNWDIERALNTKAVVGTNQFSRKVRVST